MQCYIAYRLYCSEIRGAEKNPGSEIRWTTTYMGACVTVTSGVLNHVYGNINCHLLNRSVLSPKTLTCPPNRLPAHPKLLLKRPVYTLSLVPLCFTRMQNAKLPLPAACLMPKSQLPMTLGMKEGTLSSLYFYKSSHTFESFCEHETRQWVILTWSRVLKCSLHVMACFDGMLYTSNKNTYFHIHALNKLYSVKTWQFSVNPLPVIRDKQFNNNSIVSSLPYP
jgi:hypothetical protein